MVEDEKTVRTLTQTQLKKVIDEARPGAGMIYDQARAFRGILDEVGLGYLDFFNAMTVVVPFDGEHVRDVKAMVDFDADMPGVRIVAEIPLDVPAGMEAECLKAVDDVNRHYSGACCFLNEQENGRSRIVFYADDFLLAEDRSFAVRCFERLYYLIKAMDASYGEVLGPIWES